MMGREATALNGGAHLRPPPFPFHLRPRQALRQRVRRFSKALLTPYANYQLLGLVFVAALIAGTAVYVITALISPEVIPFDDVADMRIVAEEDDAFVLRRQNETAELVGDPFRNLNATDIRESRLAWDYIYGEIVRKPVQPVLTKYKTRLLRELLKRTHYVLARKLAPAMDVSCNYLNDIDDQDSLHSFTCSGTSHRCPDGSFSPHDAFAPKEGSSITWSSVVIMLVVSAGREPFLRAAAETWISRLHPDATLFFARDDSEPEFPESILHRPNTVIYNYGGPVGMDSLDLKAFQALSKAYEMFALKGKKYFVKIDDDSFLFGHNLIRFLNKVEHWFSGREQAIYFGHPFCGHGDLEALNYEKWCYAGGGAYGLSVEALQILITQIKGGCEYFYGYVAKAPDMHPANDRYGGRYEDIMVGRCLRQARTRSQLRGTSLLACGSFFPYAPLHYYKSFGNSKEAMCKKLQGDVITIHNLEPSAIRYLDHMVFEYPLGGEFTPFAPENERVQELIDICSMAGKKMSCDLSKVSNLEGQEARHAKKEASHAITP